MSNITKRTLKRPVQSGGLDSFLQPKNKRAPRKTLVYGCGGIGKSTFASQFPNAVFWVTDPGLGTLECRKFPRSTTYEEFIHWKGVLKNNLSDFETLVLDSLGALEQLIWKYTCENYRNKTGALTKLTTIDSAPYGAGYLWAMRYWNETFSFLDELNEKHGKEIVLIAHSRPDTTVNVDTQDALKMMPAVHKHVQNRLDQWCDEIFYAYIPMIAKSETQGDKTKYKGTKGRDVRKMTFIGTGNCMAKNRLNFNDGDEIEMEFSYKTYIEHVNKFYSKGK